MFVLIITFYWFYIKILTDENFRKKIPVDFITIIYQ